MSVKSKLLKIGLPVLVLMIGIVIMSGLVSSRKAPRREARQTPGALVRVIEANSETVSISVKGTGTVQAAKEISIVPQVAGVVKRLGTGFDNGRFVRKGDLIIELDGTDYRLALDQARASLANAEYALSAEQSSARVARQQWERLGMDKDEPDPSALVLHEPQLKKARAALVAAEATVQRAHRNIKRTRLHAPFNALVSAKTIDAGQYVRAGSPVGHLISTDTAEIIVPLSADKLKWLSIPRQNQAEPGSKAAIKLSAEADEATARTWTGQIVRTLATVDPKSHMISVVIKAAHPYRVRNSLPLRVGSFVEVNFKGAEYQNVIVLPREAIRANSTVWLMDESGILKTQTVNILRIQNEEAIINKGLSVGDQIILTNLSGVADGMKLRVQSKGGKQK